MVNCAVSSCKNRSATSNMRNHGVSYHLFPPWPYIRDKWRIFCGHAEIWRPTRTSVICSDHFTPSSFEVVTNNRRKLVEGAIPTANIILCKEEPPAKFPKSEKTSTAVATEEVSSQLQIKVENLEVKLQSHSQSIPQSLQSHSPFNSQPLTQSVHQTIPELSTTTTPVSELVETPRIKRLRNQLQFKNNKIRKLQAKNRYLRKKVLLYKNTLQELVNNLDLFH